MQRGKFVVFEGIDGSGKSTQISLLLDYLRQKDKYNEVFLGREPTRKAKEVIRRLKEDLDPDSEAMVMARGYIEDRKEHYKEIIWPLLNWGAHVICDRFTLSTLAYQSNGVGLGVLTQMHITEEIGTPDLTFYFDIPVATAQERMRKRLGAPEKFEKPEFQEKLAGRYENIIRLSKEDESLRDLVGRIEIVDATQSIEDLARNIREVYDLVMSK